VTNAFATSSAASVVNGIDLAKHRGLVHSIALRIYQRRMHSRDLPGLTYDDLVAAAWEGLLAGARKFDHSRGHAESTYLIWWIRHAVGRAFENHARLVRVPVWEQVKRHKEGTTRREFTVRLDAPLDASNPDSGSLHEAFADPNTDALDPEAHLVANDLHEELAAAIDCLPARHATVLRGRLAERTLFEIGVELGLSRERVRQLEVEAVEMLGAAVRGEHRRARALWRRLHESARWTLAARSARATAAGRAA
jgi:RNA polymerase nonessential primary-like sigma factor